MLKSLAQWELGKAVAVAAAGELATLSGFALFRWILAHLLR